MKFGGENLSEMAARRTAADWVWGGVGFTTAAVSAGFATYMAVVGPPGFGRSGPAQFGLFASLARMSPLDKAMRPLHGSSQSQSSQTSKQDTVAAAAGGGSVDFAPTGTVTEPQDGRKIEPNQNARPASGAASLPGFVLRDVFDGKALVESRSSLALVAPGSNLDGAGQVESIERRGDAWVVKTTSGIITTAAR